MQDMADDINYDELIKMIEELYCMSKKALVNYALRHINTKAEAEDVVQNSFVTMLRKPHLFKFDKPQDNIPYMMIVVRNEATKYMRSVEREVHSEIDHAANIIDTEEQLIMKEAFADLNEAAANLPHKYADILYLKYAMKLDNKVINEILHITEDNVRQRLCRARKMLRAFLQKGGE